MTTSYGPRSGDIERFLRRLRALSDTDWWAIETGLGRADADVELAIHELLAQDTAVEEAVDAAADAAEGIASEEAQRSGCRLDEDGIGEAYELAQAETRKLTERTMHRVGDPEWEGAVLMAAAAAMALVVRPWLPPAHFDLLYHPFRDLIALDRSPRGRPWSKPALSSDGAFGPNDAQITRFLEGVRRLSPSEWRAAMSIWASIPDAPDAIARETAEGVAGDWQLLRIELAQNAARAVAAQDVLDQSQIAYLYGTFEGMFPF